jgi:hypothetical protein
MSIGKLFLPILNPHEAIFSESIQLGTVALLRVICANWARVVLVLPPVKVFLVF